MCNVLDDKTAPNDLKLDLTQHYVFKIGNKEKTLNSLVTLKLRDGMIEHHEEEWDHKSNSSDFFNEARKKLTAKIIEKTVTSDPSKV